ncbi:MAG: nicotinate-nucleotide adenylyltransferase [Rhodobiaceae bacterium]|nr:nicotinate-nucleotide adenylyltransferase [Rhodobiaceae bacterium]
MRIGLLGGSFNPAHAGHRHISLLAQARLRLDVVWWLVTPGNPLKDHAELAAMERRLANAQAVAGHPRIRVTGYEAAIGTTYTADTLEKLTAQCPSVRFVWLMGADNLATFHHWDRWRDIARTIPFAVLDRPGATLRALSAPAAQALARFRIPEFEAETLPDRAPPAWVFLFGPRSPESSTRLRQLARHP